MGIRIHRNTWRAPLQLIDSWLPHPPATSARQHLSSVAQRFARAGWLGRTEATSFLPTPTTCHPVSSTTQPNCSHRAVAVRVVQSTRPHGDGSRTDNRVVLSGRMADVCAELERLAALEPSLGATQH